MTSFTRSKTHTPPVGVLAGPGKFYLNVTGTDKKGSQYDVNVTLDTEYASGQSATLRIQSIVNGSWFTHRETTLKVPRRPGDGNFMGDGQLHYTFATVTDANRAQMRIQVTTVGQTFACDSWNEGNM